MFQFYIILIDKLKALQRHRLNIDCESKIQYSKISEESFICHSLKNCLNHFLYKISKSIICL